MVLRIKILIVALSCVLGGSAGALEPAGEGVRLKELGRLAGAKEKALVGYGLVTGLAGTGDSARSQQTVQSIRNILLRFDVNVPVDDLRSRNSAAVMVTSSVPPFAHVGDKLDVNVTSLGDARSLTGGTLLLTHLTGADGRVYALAQGPVSVGGFSYDLNGNLIQKNHPTAALVPSGAVVERPMDTRILGDDGHLHYVLYEPDFTTASRIVDSLNAEFGSGHAQALGPGHIRMMVSEADRSSLVGIVTRAESVTVLPVTPARVVVNERTGTVVSGGGVTISSVTITHGDLRVAISTDFLVSQPFLVRGGGNEVRTQVVPDTTIEVEEAEPLSLSLPSETSVADLVAALKKVRASSRDVITILQAIKRAGALHAELIIQ